MLTDRFANELLLILLRYSTWRAQSTDGQTCYWVSIDFVKGFNPESPGLRRADLLLSFHIFHHEIQLAEPGALKGRFAIEFLLFSLRNSSWRAQGAVWEAWALMGRFAMDLASVFLRDWLWRALGSDGQICNRVGIDFLKELTLESPGLWWTNL